MVNVNAPLASVCAPEEYVPPVSVTVPVGVPEAPETVTGTESDCTVVMLEDAGVTVTVAGGGAVTVTVAEPLWAA